MEWCNDFRKTIVDGSWTNSGYDERIFDCRPDDGRIVVLTTYVDENILIGDYMEAI